MKNDPVPEELLELLTDEEFLAGLPEKLLRGFLDRLPLLPPGIRDCILAEEKRRTERNASPERK